MARGKKTGGRQKGTPNKATTHREALLNATLTGVNAVKFLADVMSNPEFPFNVRFAAAKELAPYQHPKKASVQADVNANVSHDDFWTNAQRVRQQINGHANGRTAGGSEQ